MGLIDYGQSKQLPNNARIAFAKLIVALDKEDKPVGFWMMSFALLPWHLDAGLNIGIRDKLAEYCC